jgi:formate dehydrogenase maturation protein FdhE
MEQIHNKKRKFSEEKPIFIPKSDKKFYIGDDASFGLPPALSSNLEDLLAEKADRAKEREEENKLSPKVAVMKPILRFLQLLCENHNRQMQNLLRDQVAAGLCLAGSTL